MSKNIVFEGWLTKSPPIKRIWRTKWRRRWFALRQSGELPGQYFLDYYADRHCRRLKGTINLDFCEQVDAGLHMERGSNCSMAPKLRGSVFTIKTQSRTYHLEADCGAEMEKWVDAICKVCGLRATENSANVSGIYENNVVGKDIAMRSMNDSKVADGQHSPSRSVNTGNINDVQNYDTNHMNDQYESDGTGPYIPISECITGVRATDANRAFTFDPKNIIISSRTPLERNCAEKNHMYFSQPQIRVHNVEFSENESNVSDDECKSLNASQCNIGNWTVAKSFTKKSSPVSPHHGLEENGPPVPPRPPKTFIQSRDSAHRESFQGPKFQEPTNIHDDSPFPWVKLPRRMSHGTAPLTPCHASLIHTAARTDDEDDCALTYSMQYCNLLTLPPAVDRALKPRHSSRSVSHVNHLNGQALSLVRVGEEGRPDVLQYLDLDLQSSNSPKSKVPEVKRKSSIVYGKSDSEADNPYKTVDFLKTEAFNITRQDAEASRSNQH